MGDAEPGDRFGDRYLGATQRPTDRGRRRLGGRALVGSLLLEGALEGDEEVVTIR
jgi:hypothetical protein